MSVEDSTLDAAVRDYLVRKIPLGRRSAGFPSVEEYHAYLNGEMNGETLDRMLAYLREHPKERDFIVSARDAVSNSDRRDFPRPPARWIRDAQRLAGPSGVCPRCGSKPAAASAVRAAVWGVSALGAFTLSFVFSKYFLQFLALAAVLGLRWALEALPRRTQIFVQRSEPAVITGHNKEGGA